MLKLAILSAHQKRETWHAMEGSKNWNVWRFEEKKIYFAVALQPADSLVSSVDPSARSGKQKLRIWFPN